MVSIESLVCVCLILVVAGCVAPEAPPAPRVSQSAVAKPAISTAGYEDAPLPNRKMGGPAADPVIRVAH